MICFITGGARSGKSGYAQKAALQLSNEVTYIATAKRNEKDLEFSGRISRHEADRDHRWTTIEEPLYPSMLSLNGKVLVLDCVTLWLSNIFSRYKYDVDQSLQHLQKEIDGLQKLDASFFIISNEVGMGIHADTEIGRKFTDLQGWANQYIAGKADEAIFMVSGLPLVLKAKKL